MLLSSETEAFARDEYRIPLLTCPRDKSGALVYLSYNGVVDITPELGLVLAGSPDAKTTAFGNSCKCLLSTSS